MTPEQTERLSYTVSHFKEVARRNRFAENNKVEHDEKRCVICHPELLSLDPFETYLEVVAQSVKVRRPRLDGDLVDEINKDLDLLGLDFRVSVDSLLSGDQNAVSYWSDWIRDALATGLGLLSIHSKTSMDFSLEEGEERGLGGAVESRVQEIMSYQKLNM